MADDIDRAQSLLGVTRKEKQAGKSTATSTTTGTAMSDSVDGVVTVDLGGTTVAEDTSTEGTYPRYAEVNTTVAVKEGDTVQITLIGATAKTPMVTGVVGGGDRMKEAIDKAQQTAESASGLTYLIIVNDSTVEQDPSGAFIPATLSAKSWVRKIENDAPTDTAYSGRFAIEASTDNTTWTTVYTATADNSTVSLAYSTIQAAVDGVRYVRVTCYQEGDTIVQMAQTLVSIVQATGGYLVHTSDGMYVCSTMGEPNTGSSTLQASNGFYTLLNGKRMLGITSGYDDAGQPYGDVALGEGISLNGVISKLELQSQTGDDSNSDEVFLEAIKGTKVGFISAGVRVSATTGLASSFATMQADNLSYVGIPSFRTPVPITSGGTGAATAEAALKNLGLTDSGWKWLSGPYGTDSQGVKYRLVHGICYVFADLGGDSGKNITSSGWTAGTLPSGYRPATNVLTAADGKGNNLGQMQVMSTGAVKCWLFNGSSVYYAGFICYPV